MWQDYLLVTQFWQLPESTEDVFTLFSANDIRRTRDVSLANLETLILAVTSRLFALRNHPSFPNLELAPEKEALNCIRVLTRVLPFVYEADNLEPWEEKFFWGVRRKRAGKAQGSGSEVLFDEANPDGTQQDGAEEQPEFEDAKPLAEELLDTLVDLMFYSGFTIPVNERTKSRVNYSIWTSGVGCNTTVPSNSRMENNRTEVLRLLLTLAGKSMYMPASMYLGDNSQTLRTDLNRRAPNKRSQGHYIPCDVSRQADCAIYAVLDAEYCLF